MSLLSSIGGLFSGAVKAASTIAGAIGSINQIKQAVNPGGSPVFGGGGPVSMPQLPPLQTQSISNAAMPGLGSIGRAIGRLGTRVGPIASRVGGAVARGAGRVIRDPRTGAVVATIIAGMAYDLAGNLLGPAPRRYRRINPCNARAARRAIRRIKGVRKLLHSIEKQLPKQRSSACAPRSFGRKKCR